MYQHSTFVVYEVLYYIAHYMVLHLLLCRNHFFIHTTCPPHSVPDDSALFSYTSFVRLIIAGNMSILRLLRCCITDHSWVSFSLCDKKNRLVLSASKLRFFNLQPDLTRIFRPLVSVFFNRWAASVGQRLYSSFFYNSTSIHKGTSCFNVLFP